MKKSGALAVLALLVAIVGVAISVYTYFSTKYCMLCDDLDDEFDDFDFDDLDEEEPSVLEPAVMEDQPAAE